LKYENLKTDYLIKIENFQIKVGNLNKDNELFKDSLRKFNRDFLEKAVVNMDVINFQNKYLSDVYSRDDVIFSDTACSKFGGSRKFVDSLATYLDQSDLEFVVSYLDIDHSYFEGYPISVISVLQDGEKICMIFDLFSKPEYDEFPHKLCISSPFEFDNILSKNSMDFDGDSYNKSEEFDFERLDFYITFTKLNVVNYDPNEKLKIYEKFEKYISDNFSVFSFEFIDEGYKCNAKDITLLVNDSHWKLNGKIYNGKIYSPGTIFVQRTDKTLVSYDEEFVHWEYYGNI